MKIKRIFTLFLCAVMVLSMIPAIVVATGAAELGEGMWTTYQSANNYPREDDEPDAAYPPESGYEYTSEGFSIVQPEWKDVSPFVTVSTKTAQPIKEGVYLKFRVDAYAYGGDISADHWIAISLNTGTVEADGSVNGKIQPGSTAYGGGWLTLLRGFGDGNVTSIVHHTDPKTDDFGGTFIPQGSGVSAPAEIDNEGREIYTFEVKWNGSEYEILLNGVAHPGMYETADLMERLSSDGEFFVGITMMDAFKGGEGADLTILEYGTSASAASKPVGDDSKEPGENEMFYAPIAEPDTVPANTPAILWDPSTYNLKSGNNVSFTAKGDNTWTASATGASVFFNLSPKRAWSYAAEDFPVFGIMFRNLWVETGVLWYAAGEYSGATDGLTVPFSVYDGEFYGKEDEYVFIPCNLEDLWEGRINNIRLDMYITDETCREFDLCFAGMFRSEDEAYAYAEAWLTNIFDDTPVEETTEAPAVEETTEAPYEETTQAPYEETTEAPYEETTQAPYEETTEAPYEETTAPALVETTAEEDTYLDPWERPQETTSRGEDDSTGSDKEENTRRDDDDDDDDDEDELLSVLGCKTVIGWSGMVTAVILAAACLITRKKSEE